MEVKTVCRINFHIELNDWQYISLGLSRAADSLDEICVYDLDKTSNRRISAVV